AANVGGRVLDRLPSVPTPPEGVAIDPVDLGTSDGSRATESALEVVAVQLAGILVGVCIDQGAACVVDLGRRHDRADVYHPLAGLGDADRSDLDPLHAAPPAPGTAHRHRLREDHDLGGIALELDRPPDRTGLAIPEVADRL